MSLLLLLKTQSGGGVTPPASVASAFRVLVASVDVTQYVSMEEDTIITAKQNERSTAQITFLPGFVPNKLDVIQIYDTDGVTLKFGGYILVVGTESYEQGSHKHKTPCQCVDSMVALDWCFWTRTYSAPVTLKTVLSNLIADKLLPYSIQLDPEQDDGDTLEPFTVGSGGIGEKASDVLRSIADRCNPTRVIQMSPLNYLRVLLPGTNAAPSNVTNANSVALDLNWEYSDFTPANKVTLVCGPSSDGTPTQSWTVGAPDTYWEVDIQARMGGYAGGTLREVGIADRTVSPSGQGGYYYWDDSVGKGRITVGLGAKAPVGTVLEFVYTAIYPFSVSASTGATPVIEEQFQDENQLLVAPAQDEVNGLLLKLNQSPKNLHILSLTPGFKPSQAFAATLSDRELTTANYTVTQVTSRYSEFFYNGQRTWIYEIEATQTSNYQGSYLDQMRSLISSGGSASAVVASTGGGGSGTGGVGGTGIVGTLSKWSGSTTLTSSLLSETGTTVFMSGTFQATTLVGSVAGSQLTGALANGTQDLITRLGTIVSGSWNAGGGTFAGSLLPASESTYDLGSSTYHWRRGFISEMISTLFVKETQQLYGGWLMVTKNAGTFKEQVAAADTTIDFGQGMTANQFVLVRAADLNDVITEEYIQVVSLFSGTRYNVTRNLSGAGAKNWAAGTPYAVRGLDGDGWIELNAFDTPRMSVWTQGSNYNNSVETIRIGHLEGMPNSSAGIGAYMGSSTNYLRWDGSNLNVVGGGCSIDNFGITLGTPTSFTATSAAKFVRAGGTGFGQTNDINAVYSQAFSGDTRIVVENTIIGTGVGAGGVSGKAKVSLVAHGWDNTGSGSQTTIAQIDVRSEVGVSRIVNTADETQISGLLNAVGGQIQFPSTQNPSGNANVLDDYEEITSWTPTLQSAGGGTPTYGTRSGQSIKVGRKVSFWCRIILTNLGTLAAGTLTVAGLPYTGDSDGAEPGFVVVPYFANLATAMTSIAGFTAFSDTYFSLTCVTAGGLTSIAYLNATDLTNTSDLFISGCYRSAS